MSSKRFLTLLEGTADAAFAIDVAGRISAWNQAASELFGLNETQTMGVSCHQILHCSDDNGTRCSEQLNISSATVNNHIRHILTKLDAHTRLEAIRRAESLDVI